MHTFIKTYHHVMLDKDPRMTKPMKEVYNLLLSYEETDSVQQVFPSTARIAEFTCNSPATVKRATKALQEIGLIKKTQRFNSTNIFQVLPYSTKDQTAHREPSTNDAYDIPDEVDSSHSIARPLIQSHDTAHHEPSDSSQRATIRSNNKIKKEDQLLKEGQGLSRDDESLTSKALIAEDEFDQIMSTEEEETKPAVIEDDEPLDHDYDNDFDFQTEEADFSDYDIPNEEDLQTSDRSVASTPSQSTPQIILPSDIERNQRNIDHQKASYELYQRMRRCNAVAQFKHKPATPDWLK